MDPKAERKSLPNSDRRQYPVIPDVLHRTNPYALGEMHPTYKEAHRKAIELIQGDGRINMAEFNNRDLEEDISSVTDKLKSFEMSTPKEGELEAIVQAEILEAMIYDLIKNHNLFGSNVKAVLPSAYDDLFLANDVILSENLDGRGFSYNGVSIDIVFGEAAYSAKTEKTKRFLMQGRLGKVKYFKSENGDYKGELNNIPHFDIGVNRETLFKLSGMWVSGNVNGIKQLGLAKGLIGMMIEQCDEYQKIDKQNVKRVYSEEKVRLERIRRSL